MNVILICCDTLRWDHCGPYHRGRTLRECGSPEQPDWVVPTPNIDRLAQRGTVFDACWSGSYPTMPARRDLFTGRFDFLERGWGPLEEWDADLARAVSGSPGGSLQQQIEEGYPVSYLIADNLNYWLSGGNYQMGFSGFEFIRGNQDDRWYTDPDAFPCPEVERHSKLERYFRNIHHYRRGEEDETCAKVFRTAADWLQRNRSHAGFYLMIDSFAPHEPWDPPEELVTRFDPRGYDVAGWASHPPYVPWREHMNEQQFNSFRARYAAKVVLVDRWLGVLLETLDRLDLWRSTLVIFTSDHGTFNGDHGRIGKNQTHLHDALAHVPLILAHPTQGQGERRSQLVQLVDTYTTALVALGRPVPEDRHGIDLAPVLADPAAATRDLAVAGLYGASITATDGRWVLHQAPVAGNQPLYWYGYTAMNARRGALGPVVDGRRQAQVTPFGTPTWLSDRLTDPSELINLAAEQPRRCAALQQALVAKLAALGAPPEQVQRLALGR